MSRSIRKRRIIHYEILKNEFFLMYKYIFRKINSLNLSKKVFRTNKKIAQNILRASVLDNSFKICLHSLFRKMLIAVMRSTKIGNLPLYQKIVNHEIEKRIIISTQYYTKHIRYIFD